MNPSSVGEMRTNQDTLKSPTKIRRMRHMGWHIDMAQQGVFLCSNFRLHCGYIS